MFRLGVLSDTHGRPDMIREAAIKLGRIDALAFLGDLISDLPVIRGVFDVPIYAVRGNGDLFVSEPNEMVLELEGKRILICHGHDYRVKMTYDVLYYHALERQCDAALFGHTHMPYSSYDRGVLLFNPGAASSRLYPTCGVLEFRENGLSPRVLNLN